MFRRNLSDRVMMLLTDFLKIRNKLNDKKVVFTNGCFDIIHAGHIAYLEEAKSLGDILVVGLNSDSSVKRLKGEKRPIVSENERKYVLESIKFIDYVFIFEEDTPYNLIKSIRPDILVKGGDWDISEIVGADIVLENGGEVKKLLFKEGLSTSNIIEKMPNYIKDQYGNPVVSNPVNPDEDFADKWEEHPEQRTHFFEWLNQVKRDRADIIQEENMRELSELLKSRFGESIMEKAVTEIAKFASPAILIHVDKPPHVEIKNPNKPWSLIG